MLTPTQKVPQLEVSLINGTRWELQSQDPDNFTMIIFYRGLHCPICRKYLQSFTRMKEEFASKGVHIIAISGDNETRARKTSMDWDIEGLPLGYGMDMEEARDWGLYVSTAISDGEPEQFFEPGLFLIRPDGTLYAASVQTMPFARPEPEALLKAITFILDKDYPARGVEGNVQDSANSQ